ncbi:hypothetical protein VXQ47_14155 [Acinetobacter pittii]|uniref:hypothetical protein n=1 Tax=Acinetobacter TaxID=469 RepID=UPI00029C9773|nr:MULTISPECIES: hypothetical protein [Acinetobacter]EKU36732.1 hypothetical protein ACINWC141_0754 [Acinetobacter sp. WC-141]MBM7140506.1 hypothetical protein [Acinetobacter sp. 105-3]MCU4550306.1 hypothetical protein [Acinetobacter pittii]
MTVYSVSYDLNEEGQNYKDLIDEIKKFNGYCKVMKSYWFVCSDNDANSVSDRLRKHIDNNDYLLVMETSTNRQGWLNKDVWAWLKQHQASSV